MKVTYSNQKHKKTLPNYVIHEFHKTEEEGKKKEKKEEKEGKEKKGQADSCTQATTYKYPFTK